MTGFPTALRRPEEFETVTSKIATDRIFRTPEPGPGDERDELLQELPQLRADVSGGRIETARAAVQDLAARWPDSPRVQYWTRVLAPPTASAAPGPDPRSGPLERERAWLKKHARQYPGCWLAVYGDRLIAADPDLGVVLTITDQSPEGQHALLYQQPGHSEAQ
jgi:hypothetical protein